MIREPITGPVSPKQGSVHRTKAKEYVRLSYLKKGELWIGVYGMKDKKRKKNLRNVIRDL